MIRFNKTEIENQIIPSRTGIFTLSDINKVLYINKTANIDKSIQQLFKVAKDDKNVFQLISQTSEIGYEEYPSLFAALFRQKKLESKSYPEFNSMIKPYEQYVYLGINFEEPPYIKVVEDTQQNLFYLGPFKDRFFLFDLLDAMGELFQFPLCPDEKPFPCKRYKNDDCLGWCIKEKHETYQQAILPYIMPNENILLSKYKEYDSYYNELQFEKAEKLKHKIHLVERYYEYLKFIAITKNLSLKFKERRSIYFITNGRLSAVIENGRKIEFPLISVEFRDNEILASNKIELAERWIVYKYLAEKKDKIILDKLNAVNRKFLLKIRSRLT